MMKGRAHHTLYTTPSSSSPRARFGSLLTLLPWILTSTSICAEESATMIAHELPNEVTIQAPASVERAPWSIAWRSQLGWQRSNYAKDSPIASALLPASASHREIGFANVELDARVRLPRVRSASAKFVMQQSKDVAGTQTQARVLTWGMEFMEEDATQSLSLGKLRFNQGQNLAFHPIDVAGRHNEPKSTVGRRQDDLLAKEGDVGLRYLWLGDTLSYEALAVNASHDVMWPAQAAVQQRLSGRWDSVDWSLAHSTRSNRVWTLGTTVSTPIGFDSSLYFETMVANARQMPVALTYAIADASPSITSDSGVRSDQLWPHAVLSFQHATAVGQFEGAYYYNGSGLSATQWRSAMSQVSLASSDRGAARLPYLPVATLLASTSSDYYLRKHYVSIRYDSLSQTAGYNIEAQLLASPEQSGGASLYTALNYQLTSRMTLKLSYFVQCGGRASEFSMGPVRAQLAVRITIAL